MGIHLLGQRPHCTDGKTEAYGGQDPTASHKSRAREDPALWPCLLVVRTLLPPPLDNFCPSQQGPLPLGTAQADATPVQTASQCPSALLAAPPDLGLEGEEGGLPGHGGPVRTPTRGGLARVQGWMEAGLVSSILPLSEEPGHPVSPGKHSWAEGPVAGAKIRPYIPCGLSGSAEGKA